jgi:hypothetical protein
MRAEQVFEVARPFSREDPARCCLAEQEARRCGSPLPPAVLLSALMFKNRRLRRRVHLQPSAAWPSTPIFGLPMLPVPLPFSKASTLSPALTPSTHFPDRPRIVAEWARLLKMGGRLLFTDPITVSGALTNAEITVRSSAGFYLFVPHGYAERVYCAVRIAIAGV